MGEILYYLIGILLLEELNLKNIRKGRCFVQEQYGGEKNGKVNRNIEDDGLEKEY
jgi:hypothetical protein